MLYNDLAISVTEDDKIILDMYNTATKPAKKGLFRKRNLKGKINVIMTSYTLNKEQARELIDILEDALEDIENPEGYDSDEDEE